MATPGYDRTYNLALLYSGDGATDHNWDVIDQRLGVQAVAQAALTSVPGYSHDGRAVTIPAPGDVAAGDVVVVGALFGIAGADATAGETLPVLVDAVVTLPRPDGEVWDAVGAPVYWDDTAKKATIVSGSTAIGYTTWTASGDGAPAPVKLTPKA